MQLYANVTTNARMPVVASTYLTDFSTTSGAISQAANASQKPEYAIDDQIGYRYHGPVNIDVNAFFMHLLDHQLSTLQNINGSLVPTAFTIGNETIRGASLEVSTHSYGGFSAYGSAQYLDATFDDNTPLDGTYLPTRGKQMVESPHWIASIGGRYDNGRFFAEVTGKYVAPQYTTLMNDQTMPGYETVDLALGYKLPDYGALKKPVIRLNMTNIGNKSYISSVATVATNAVATKGLNGATIAAGTPLYYIGAPLAVMLTLSTSF
jgi:iron complex outermembrane receptor protein